MQLIQDDTEMCEPHTEASALEPGRADPDRLEFSQSLNAALRQQPRAASEHIRSWYDA